MYKQGKGQRLKSESSDDEEDFESADEGEENEQSTPHEPPSWKATSPDDGKNSTSRSQVTQDNTAKTQSKMASSETDSSLSSETIQDSEKADAELKETVSIDSQDRESQSTSTENSTTSSVVQNVDTVVLEEKKVSDNDKNKQDDNDDPEIHFKGGGKEGNNAPSQLEKTQTDIEQSTDEHKDTIEKQDTTCDEEKAFLGENSDSKTDKDLTVEASPQIPESQNPKEQQEASSSSWGWGSWGSMLSQATAGLSSVLESVETSLGIPEPEEIAKKVAEDEKKVETVIEKEPTMPDTNPQDKSLDDSEVNKSEMEGNQGSFLSVFGVTGLSSVVSEGLGALEYIGKKTMDVISDGDPGLRNKRQALMSKGPSLSQILREAKEEAEYKAAHPDFKESVMDVKLTTEFDKFQGLAHLEALEILSKESESKVEEHIINLTKEELIAVKPVLRTIQEVVQIEDDEDEEQEQDFETEVSSSLAELHLNHIPNKTKTIHPKLNEWIDSCITEQTENPTCKNHVEIYTTGISALAELTACSVEQFHKIAEVMLLLAEESDTSALIRAQALKKLTLCVCREVSNLASKFAGALSTLSKESEDPEALESLITALYLESSDSSRYVQHAFKLLCPVLQQSSLSESPSKS